MSDEGDFLPGEGRPTTLWTANAITRTEYMDRTGPKADSMLLEFRSAARICLAASLAICLAAPNWAAAADAAPSSAATFEELDEIVVKGKRLSEEIAEREDKFFDLFNQINTDDRYDTNCVQIRLNSDSRMQSRACIPGFVADALADWVPFRARCQPPQEGFDEFDCLDRNDDRRLSRAEAAVRFELDAQFTTIDEDRDGEISRQEWPEDMSFSAPYMPPPPDLVLMEGSKAWYEHMMKVTQSDPRLQEMADHLGGLYQELGATQRRFNEVDAALQKKANLKIFGPRAR